ncbi:MAG TPA: DUF4112 domain-containing protein [Kofleriaceae bacterium]|nr:DUF4112 domain-containing protein [Kofleriaceae bacterium]
MATTGNHVIPGYVPPRAKRGAGTGVDHELERVQKMATILDRYMVDPILGLVLPGAGDVVGSLLGMYTISIAFRRKVSPVIIARMFLNLGVDAVLGFVPFLGDLIDVGFKANQKNVALLADHPTGKATAKDWLFVVGAALLFFGVMALSVYAIVALFRAVF